MYQYSVVLLRSYFDMSVGDIDDYVCVLFQKKLEDIS